MCHIKKLKNYYVARDAFFKRSFRSISLHKKNLGIVLGILLVFENKFKNNRKQNIALYTGGGGGRECTFSKFQLKQE